VSAWLGYRPYDVGSLFGGLEVHSRYLDNDPTLGNLFKEADFVIHLSLGGAESGSDLRNYVLEKRSGVARSAFADETLAMRIFNATSAECAFGHLVDAIPRGVSVVVLVDEYDRAILDDVRDKNFAAATAGLKALNSLMMSTKPEYSSRIRKFVITGSTRIAWSSLFSGANNIDDLTHSPLLSRILGFSDEDVRALIDALVDNSPLKQEPEQTFQYLKCWYNGYCFDGSTTSFHPFGVLSCLSKATTYKSALDGVTAVNWLSTAPIDFLGLLSKEVIDVEIKASIRSSSLALGDRERSRPRNIDIDMRSLLYQTGYLTEVPGSGGRALMVPNEHARDALLGSSREPSWLSPQAAQVSWPTYSPVGTSPLSVSSSETPWRRPLMIY
jgi:hypothetical protein